MLLEPTLKNEVNLQEAKKSTIFEIMIQIFLTFKA
jgi:hypothetical protein